MRLVLMYCQSDDCTYSCEIVHPIEAESPEAAYSMLVDKALEIRRDPESIDSEFEMFGQRFCSMYLTFLNENKQYEADMFVQVLTLDEWFKNYGDSK